MIQLLHELYVAVHFSSPTKNIFFDHEITNPPIRSPITWDTCEHLSFHNFLRHMWSRAGARLQRLESKQAIVFTSIVFTRSYDKCSLWILWPCRIRFVWIHPTRWNHKFCVQSMTHWLSFTYVSLELFDEYLLANWFGFWTIKLITILSFFSNKIEQRLM